MILAGAANAQTAVTLRGADVTDTVAVEDVFRLHETRFTRKCRQTSPLIPHSIDRYQADLDTDRCLS